LLSKLLIGLNRLFTCRSQAIIVQSAEMKEALGLPRIRIIPFGVNLSLFHPIDRTQACLKLGLGVERKRMLFANNPTIPLKQFWLAQSAFAIVRKTLPNTDLVVIWKETRERVPLYMNACDVLILTSLSEGSPNVVREAMACNLPVVSVDVGDVRELIRGARNCFITSRNSDEIARRIIQVFDSGMRTNGYELMGNLGAAKIARRIVQVYESVLSGRQVK
jgi:glycosyltransferase involved in cell wall biosynthesis